MDYDEEARKLFELLNISPDSTTVTQTTKSGTTRFRFYRDLDCVFQHPKTKAKVFIGNQNAAASTETLEAHNITQIVNCQDAHAKNFHEGNDTYTYYRFPISWWFKEPNMDSAPAIKKYLQGLFDFIDNALLNGQSVLIHCLAGAHRAGSAGVAYLMHAAGLDLSRALTAAKSIRPVVNPIGHLGELLKRYDLSTSNHNRTAELIKSR